MPAVKSLDRISSKWARVASVSQEEYEEGVRNPRRSWADATKEAELAYEQGIQQAIQKKAFGKGVTKAGDVKWSERTLSKGPTRWSEGIRLSTNAYEEGFAPYREVIMRVTLPPRGPKGDPKNIQRVGAIAKALHDEKLKRWGG